MILKVDHWLDHIAKGVQEVEVAAGIGLQHVPEGFVAEFPDGAEELEVCDGHAGAVDHTGIHVPEFADGLVCDVTIFMGFDFGNRWRFPFFRKSLRINKTAL